MADYTGRYSVVNVGRHWRLMYGDTPISTPRMTTSAHAKRHAFQRFGVVPEVRVTDAEPVDLTKPLHAAIEQIESRFGPAQLISVTPTHYYIRRKRFGSEVPVRYAVMNGMVYAREDAQLV